jgi:hypothetical protein
VQRWAHHRQRDPEGSSRIGRRRLSNFPPKPLPIGSPAPSSSAAGKKDSAGMAFCLAELCSTDMSRGAQHNSREATQERVLTQVVAGRNCSTTILARRPARRGSLKPFPELTMAAMLGGALSGRTILLVVCEVLRGGLQGQGG